jgi:hypothetical protein
MIEAALDKLALEDTHFSVAVDVVDEIPPVGVLTVRQ